MVICSNADGACGLPRRVVHRIARASATSLVLPRSSSVTAFMGDSLTQNWVLPNYDTNPAINFGMSGQTTVQMLARFDTVLASGASIVVIERGINDLYYLGPQATNIDSIASMAAQAKAAGMRVILCSLVPDSFDYLSGMAPTTAGIVAMNERILLLAKARGYLYADYYDAMPTPEGGQRVSLTIDGLHPNNTGYAYLWNVLEPLLAESY
jgi:lysophospholipase L1-like esterase